MFGLLLSGQGEGGARIIMVLQRAATKRTHPGVLCCAQNQQEPDNRCPFSIIITPAGFAKHRLHACKTDGRYRWTCDHLGGWVEVCGLMLLPSDPSAGRGIAMISLLSLLSWVRLVAIAVDCTLYDCMMYHRVFHDGVFCFFLLTVAVTRAVFCRSSCV